MLNAMPTWINSDEFSSMVSNMSKAKKNHSLINRNTFSTYKDFLLILLSAYNGNRPTTLLHCKLIIQK